MSKGVNIDGVLVTWGDRLFYPRNRTVKGNSPPKLTEPTLQRRAADTRGRIRCALAPRVPQVMVKVTGGGRCMRAIAAHFRYTSKNGRLEMEDERGESIRGSHSVRDLAEDWRLAGTQIPRDVDAGWRREAYNIMLSMPRGTDPLGVQRAARAFARVELAGHRYVMVLHDHQANPHVHISVRAEGRSGGRLNPRKADLQRWRETFAEKLRDTGVEAQATRRSPFGRTRRPVELWRLKAHSDGRLNNPGPARESGDSGEVPAWARECWHRILDALLHSESPADVMLARSVSRYLQDAARHPEQHSSGPDRDSIGRT